MYITNTNIIQPRILHKPELNETLPKINLKKNRDRILSCITYSSSPPWRLLSVYYLLQLSAAGWGCRGCPPAEFPKTPTEGRDFWAKKMPHRCGAWN